MRHLIFSFKVFLLSLIFSASAFAVTACTPASYTSPIVGPNGYFAQLVGNMDGTETCVLMLNTSATPTIRITGNVGTAYGGVSIYSNAYLPGSITANLSNYTINGVPTANSASFIPAAIGSVYDVQGDYTYLGNKYTVQARLTFAGTAGNETVTLSNASITTVSVLPTVTAINPTSGPLAGGTAVTITGTNFTGATAVTIGGVAATGITVVNATTITATTPAGTAGAKDVVVTTPGGSGTGTGLFTYAAASTVTAINPTSGPLAGGTAVTITGTNFTGATAVTIGGVAATGITVVNATTITATTPAGTAGAKDVVVTTPGGSGTGTGLFTYTNLDPTLDPAVRGIIDTQVMATQRFTRTQIDNISGHLQELHRGFNLKSNRFNLKLNVPGLERFMMVASALIDHQKASTITPNAQNDFVADPVAQLAKQLIDNHDSSIPDTYFAQNAADTDPTLNERLFGNASWGLWASGKLDIGRMDNQANATSRFSSSGVTFGLDRKMDDDLILGVAIGLGSDKTEIDSFGTQTKSSLHAGTVYATYHPAKDLFIDAILGYGRLSYANNRWVSAGNTLVTGDRSGRSWFGSLSVSDTMTFGKLTLEPYLRGDFMSSKLDAYAEQNSATYALSYDSTSVNSRSIAAGAVGYHDYQLSSGVLTSLLKAQYLRSYNREVTQGMFYSDLGPSGGYYLLSSTPIPQAMGSLGVGFTYKRRDGLTTGMTYTVSAGSNSYRSQMLRADIRMGF